MKLIVTIDVEEDEWGGYNHSEFSVRNIEKLPSLQELFDRYEVKPTYLITYPVASIESSAGILRDISSSGQCEIGAHLHPWSTPPIDEVSSSKKQSMACNIDSELQLAKLQVLTEAIRENFGQAPVSFRTGRWGVDASLTHHLSALGYKVDSSVTPYVDWSEMSGVDFSAVPLRSYWRSTSAVIEGASEDLMEIPPSIGFLQHNFERSQRLHQKLRSKLSRQFHLPGVYNRLNLLNLVWLSPEMHTSAELVNFAQVLVKRKVRFLNMTFHSSSLRAGATPFVTSAAEEQEFIGRIESLIKFTQSQEIKSATLAEAYHEVHTESAESEV